MSDKKYEAQQQEPVAWYDSEKDCAYTLADCEGRAQDDLEPLYLAPASKPWVGLTEKEHTEIAVQCGCMSADWVFYGATVERILKEKNS